MNFVLLISLFMAFKEPPTWYEAVHLHEPLLPGSVKTLTASEDFIAKATKLAEGADVDRVSDMHPRIVHRNYRAALLGEHILITPNDEPELIELRGSTMPVLSIVVGFNRKPDTTICEFTGLFIVDGKGLIHEYCAIPTDQRRSFEMSLKGWLTRGIEATKAARERANKRLKAGEQSHALEPAAGPDSNEASTPPAQ